MSHIYATRGPIALSLLLLSLPAARLTAQTTQPSITQAADSGSFIIRRGRDTVATERFTRTASQLRGSLAIHNSAHTSQQYKAVIAPDATLPLIEVTIREDIEGGGVKGKILQRAQVIFKEDSAAIDALTSHGIQTRVFGTGRGAIPYLNLSFALLEQTVRRGRAAGPSGSEVPLFNLGGGQTVNARLAPVGPDSLRLAIGEVEFRLRVDREGRILGGRIPAQDVVADRR